MKTTTGLAGFCLAAMLSAVAQGALSTDTLKESSPASPAITIPANALTHLGSLPGVWVVKHGEARFRWVKTGRVSDGKAEVLSGLSGSETLILPPFVGIHDGTPLDARQRP